MAMTRLWKLEMERILEEPGLVGCAYPKRSILYVDKIEELVTSEQETNDRGITDSLFRE
jgi:hypothetical protein